MPLDIDRINIEGAITASIFSGSYMGSIESASYAATSFTSTSSSYALSSSYSTSASFSPYQFNNTKIIKSITELPTPTGSIIYVADNTTYFANGLVNLGTCSISMSSSPLFTGRDKSDDGFLYTGTGSMFISNNKSFSIRDMVIVTTHPSSSIFNVTSSLNNQIEIAGNIFKCNSIGSINGGQVNIFRNNYITGSSNGIIFKGNNDLLTIVDNVYQGNSGTITAVTIPTGSFQQIIISRNHFDMDTNQTALNITSSLVNTSGKIIDCSFEGSGSRLVGINGNTTGWTINYGDNIGIGGIQFNDVEVIITADASLGNSAGTYTETVRGYILPLSAYDSFATTMEAKIYALMTNTPAVQVGLRNLTSATNLPSTGSAVSGTDVTLESKYTTITPGNQYTAYYVKPLGAATRKNLKIRLKTY
jgi:hypothetical protein